MDYKKAISITEEALNLIDLRSFLIRGRDLGDIYNLISGYIADPYNNEANSVKEFMVYYPEVFESSAFNGYDIFNYMAEDEFLKYCKKRYPEIHWGSEVVERYWVL